MPSGVLALVDTSVREDETADGDTYTVGMQRELAEEVQLDADFTDEKVGLIFDPSNEVGKVHLGVVHRFILSAPKVRSNEEDLAEGGFVSIEELRLDRDRLETWSQLALDAIYP